jgi:tetratricopeptide (TPR) repeat protein
MTKHAIWKAAIVLACAAALLSAQGGKKKKGQPEPAAAAEPAGSPVAKQPTVKSPKEAQAVQALFGAQDPDSRIKAANDLVSNFPNTEFKSIAMFFAEASSQQKNDYENTIVYGEKALEADPQQYQAMLMMAQTIAARTREFDLDREEKLKNAEGYATKALEIVKVAPRPNATVTDEQWEAAKKDFTSQGLEVFALAASARNQPDKAIEAFNQVIAASPNVDPTTLVRLAAAYSKVNKFDDAIATLDKVIAMPELNVQVKQIAQAERARALQAKNKAAAAK